MKKVIVALCIIAVFAFIFIYFRTNNVNNIQQKIAASSSAIRYMPIGDSYSNGHGLEEDESFPSQLTSHLKESGVDIDLIANPSISGFTTQDAIENELPIFESSDVNFSTLLIGANDSFRAEDPKIFRANLQIILDRMLKKLQNKKNLIVVTLPDYSLTPEGKQYEQERGYSQKIIEFNNIIKEEALKRSLSVADIYGVSQRVTAEKDLLISDGLHPSGKQYALWEKEIFPVAYDLLKKK